MAPGPASALPPCRQHSQQPACLPGPSRCFPCCDLLAVDQAPAATTAAASGSTGSSWHIQSGEAAGFTIEQDVDRPQVVVHEAKGVQGLKGGGGGGGGGAWVYTASGAQQPA